MRKVEKRLRERIKELEKELAEVRTDRQLFRDHFVRRFRWWIQLLGEKSTPNLPWLVEDDARYLKRFEWFQW